ncbi:MAG: hypothetical protein ABR976_19795 [Terracidiphilus sp.]|jgi:hypothetical protein
MTSDNSSANLRNLWQSQSQETFQMSPEQLRCKWKRLNRELLIRNRSVWIVCLFEIGVFAWILGAFPQLFMKIASAFVILGMAFMTGQVALDQHRRRLSRIRAEASGNLSSLDFLRAELERQCNFHRGLWFWSRMALLMPAMLLWGIGAVALFPWPEKIAGWSIVCVTVFLIPLAIQLNNKRSRTYQKQIDALDALRQSPAKK